MSFLHFFYLSGVFGSKGSQKQIQSAHQPQRPRSITDIFLRRLNQSQMDVRPIIYLKRVRGILIQVSRAVDKGKLDIFTYHLVNKKVSQGEK